jgi:hypothetical protein
LLQLLDVNANFVSLQKDVHPDERGSAERPNRCYAFRDKLETFSDTAAVISNLDLVISVDTSVAHLAGALATTARLFRQNAPGDWSGVISRVVVEHEKLPHKSRI